MEAGGKRLQKVDVLVPGADEETWLLACGERMASCVGLRDSAWLGVVPFRICRRLANPVSLLLLLLLLK